MEGKRRNRKFRAVWGQETGYISRLGFAHSVLTFEGKDRGLLS